MSSGWIIVDITNRARFLRIALSASSGKRVTSDMKYKDQPFCFRQGIVYGKPGTQELWDEVSKPKEEAK